MLQGTTSAALDKANKLFFSNKLYTLGNYEKILGHHPRGDDFTFGRAFNSLIVSIGTAYLPSVYLGRICFC